MKELVQSIFHADFQNDAVARGLINGVLGTPPNQIGAGIAALTMTNNQLASNIRIYCDNDEQNVQGGTRWRLMPDPIPAAQPPGYVPNAQRPRAYQPGMILPGDPGAPQYQQWVDPINGVYTLSQGCQTPNEFVQGETYSAPAFQQPGQPPMRSVVTLCDVQLNTLLHSFENIPLKKDIESLSRPPALQTGIDAFQSMTAYVMLHEFVHCRPHSREDVVLPNGAGAYEWTDLISLAPADALLNVNNYVYLALLAKLADRHWRLSKDYNDWHQRGVLVYDLTGITSKLRRWIKWKA
ncbi:MAG: hypothetical protein Q9160_007534 [Pyrenula sp. 1 TL-2023]